MTKIHCNMYEIPKNKLKILLRKHESRGKEIVIMVAVNMSKIISMANMECVSVSDESLRRKLEHRRFSRLFTFPQLLSESVLRTPHCSR